ncbi:hypothetical protein HE1_00213 [Holospora elegans E1]|uniref:Transposase IS4-like domain-containing protein n=1 Tax=Holospora elegans E1 TaxID=1427503 RepID=A0A023DX42_9PROT|nr:hypothetical protein [Holospora elegans]GAJ45896.1 hypothetical protein HE1_00213 [Holospora elegans E1]
MRTLSFAQDKDRVLNKQRWDIERLFRTMKTQGVNLENPPMKDLGRLSKLMTIVAVAILYASITGLTQECAYKKNSQSAFVIHTSQGDSGGSEINSYSLISAIF